MEKTDLYLISMAAERLGLHPQTLRKYERLGLVRPHRTLGSMRVYSGRELRRLRLIKSLVDDAGVNLEGVRRLLMVADAIERLRPLVRAERVHEADLRRRLSGELDELFRILGLDDRPE